jgi:hypothetical protein
MHLRRSTIRGIGFALALQAIVFLEFSIWGKALYAQGGPPVLPKVVAVLIESPGLLVLYAWPLENAPEWLSLFALCAISFIAWSTFFLCIEAIVHRLVKRNVAAA